MSDHFDAAERLLAEARSCSNVSASRYLVARAQVYATLAVADAMACAQCPIGDELAAAAEMRSIIRPRRDIKGERL